MKWLLLLSLLSIGTSSLAAGMMPSACGTVCLAQMAQYCPTCYARSMYGGGLPWGQSNPWWWSMGPTYYSNALMPGPWMMTGYPGMAPGFFAGGGGAFMGKPNIYVDGPKGTEVSVKVKFKEADAQWLASVPAHGEGGWKGTIQENERLLIGSSRYRYLFADYRVSDQSLQESKGFCVGQKNLMFRLGKLLSEANFSDIEVADFIEYWSVKMPKSAEYCVYPQDSEQLDKIAELEVSPKPMLTRRLVFVIQVKEAMGGKAKFTKVPQTEWAPSPVRMPAALPKDKPLIVREWGVAFLAARSQ